MGFFRTIRDSIYSPEFYRELFKKPLRASFKYFLILALFASFAQAIPAAYRFVPKIQNVVSVAGEKMLAQYPDELVITVAGGQVSTNVEEPYFIPAPDDMSATYKNLVVIDTKQPFSDEKFKQYETFALVTKDSIAFSGREREVRIERLDQVPDMTIAKGDVASLAGRVAPLARVLGPLLTVLMFLGLLMASILVLFYLVIAALLVWAVAKIKGVKAGYKDAYKIALHAVTLPFLASTFASMLGITINIPFLTTILIAVVAWINLFPEQVSSEPLADALSQ
jgi:hypothetical protein